jgi:hypothetical protein
MKLFLVFFMQAYLHAAFVPLENVDVGGVAASSGSIITQLHPNVYTATKTLPYYETNGSIQNADTLHFVFEKVTFENVFSMYDYVNSQNNALDRGDVSVPVAVQLIAKQATEPVTHSLNLLFFSSQDVLDEFDAGTEENPTAQLTSWRSDFTYCFESRDSGTMTSLNSVLASSVYDVWIAYCTRQDPSVTWPIDYNTQAEMVLTLLADNTSPFDTHIGMSRNCNIFYTATKPHPNLSVQISSFAMAASAQAYGAAKNYMLTRAVPSNASVVNAYFVSKGLNSSISYPADMQASTDQSDPDSLYATYPLNNLDTNNWLILPRGETVPVSFTRPRWFPFQTKTANEQHFHLTNIFDQMLAVDAAAFISYWNAAY